MSFCKFFALLAVLLVYGKCENSKKQLCSYAKIDEKCYCSYITDESSQLPIFTADCSRLGIQEFPSDQQFIDDLVILDLSHNGITEVDDFSNNDFSSDTLLELNLAYNKISYVSDQFFLYTRNLRVLDLSHNELSAFENPDILLGLNNLLTLDLSFNRIKIFPGDLFATVPNLLELNVAYNDLGDYFMKFTNLGNSSLGLNINLTSLQMDNLGITELHNAFFDSFHNLKHLSLADNAFSEVPVVPYSVEYLDLSGNYITTLAARNLNYHSLKTLVLNRLARLTMVDHYAFYNLQALEELYINDCGKLNQFSDLVFGVMHKGLNLPLKRLSIARNGLQTLNYTYGYLFDDLEYIDLSDNPWKCDCNLKWLKEYDNMLSSAENIRCAEPGPLRFKNLMELSKIQLSIRCKRPRASLLHRIVVPTMGILIVILVALIIYLIYMAPALYDRYRFRVSPQSPYQGVTVQVDE